MSPPFASAPVTDATHLRRVRARAAVGAGLDPHTLRRLLGNSELHPRNLPAAAILMVRRVEIAAPLPWQAHALSGDADWQIGVRAALAGVAEAAARPRGGVLPADAEAVVFADQAELLACLARAMVRGEVAARWWWQDLLPPGRAHAEAWAGHAERCPEAVAAALNLLADWNALATAWRVLDEVGADRIVGLIARATPAAASWIGLSGDGRDASPGLRMPVAARGRHPGIGNGSGSGVGSAVAGGDGDARRQDGAVALGRALSARHRAAWAALPPVAGLRRVALVARLAAQAPAALADAAVREVGRSGASWAGGGGEAGASGDAAIAGVEATGRRDAPGPASASTATPAGSDAPGVGTATSARSACRVPDSRSSSGPGAALPSSGVVPTGDRAGSLRAGGVAVRGATAIAPAASSGPEPAVPAARCDADGTAVACEAGMSGPDPVGLSARPVPAGDPVSMPAAAPNDPGSESGPESSPEPGSGHAAPAPAALHVATGLGGAWLLINALDRVGVAAPGPRPWAGLERLLRGLCDLAGFADAHADDPLWRALAWLDDRDDLAEPLRESLDPAARRALRPRLSRLAAGLAAQLAMSRAEALATLLVAPAQVHLTRAHVDVYLPLDAISLPLRLAGLDRDPGWRADYGRAILYHYG